MVADCKDVKTSLLTDRIAVGGGIGGVDILLWHKNRHFHVSQMAEVAHYRWNSRAHFQGSLPLLVDHASFSLCRVMFLTQFNHFVKKYSHFLIALCSFFFVLILEHFVKCFRILYLNLKFIFCWKQIHILCSINPLSANPTKWSITIKQFVSNLPTNCLSVFDHLVILALKGLKEIFFDLSLGLCPLVFHVCLN